MLHIYLGPSPPFDIKVSRITTNEWDVTWKDPCETGCDDGRTADYFTVFTRHFITNYTKKNRVNAPKRKITIKNLESNTEYSIIVQTTSLVSPLGYTVLSDPSNSIRRVTGNMPISKCINVNKIANMILLSSFVILAA